MKTPIYDFVQAYIQSNTTRFHMPGHKGKSYLGCEPYDITEIPGADVLYSPDGIIAESEANATELFGTGHTFYSAEGSSLAIRAMLALVRENSREEIPCILAARNVHKAFLYACALLDFEIEWLPSDSSKHVCEAIVIPEALENKLSSVEKKPCAVYITSPDYLGNMADIAALASVCNRYNVPLLVDNAHGAYLRFLSPSLHPISLGATMCCDSAHKTFPVLTGGAYLHVSQDAPQAYLTQARKYLSLFASTSPSYLILQSLDLCNAYLSDAYQERLSTCLKRVSTAKAYIQQRGFVVLSGEPLKIVIEAAASGYTGEDLACRLRVQGIECELADHRYLVLMISPENSSEDFERLMKAFAKIDPRSPLSDLVVPLPSSNTVLSPRKAILSASETVLVEHAVGRICAAPTVSCPPAVPIIMSGELITEEHVQVMKHYGHNLVDVVK